MVTSLCNNKEVHGQSLLNSFEFNNWLNASFFDSPTTSNIIFLDFRIVLNPIDIAYFGTSEILLLKNLEFAFLVDSSSSINLVLEFKFEPGSLNPIWPLFPIPNINRSIPPFEFIKLSYSL